ncbi:MAG: DUF6285 domain-containing protein [Actinomycetota bacterium]
MTVPHDPPTAAELIEAVREFLEKDVMSSTEGRVQFHARVAINVLAIVEREMELGAQQAVEHLQRLEHEGLASDEELATAIRNGSVSAEQVIDIVRESVAAKLRVANPSYLES